MPPGTLESENVSLVGYHDLDERPAIKMAMQEVGGRWYLYLGHFWHPGWSIVDVTDPAEPELLNFVPGPENNWCHQVQVADGKLVTGLDHPVRGWQPTDGAGYDLDGPFEMGAYIWDVADDPANPERLGHYDPGGRGTHRNYYDGGDYAYMTASPPEFEGYMLEVVDIADPADPEVVGQWWWPGQHEDDEREAGSEPEFDVPAPDFMAHPPYLHGPAYVDGDVAYLSYGRIGLVVLDVSDPTDPEMLGRLSFGNLGSVIGTHSAVPIPDTDYVVVNSEAILERDGDSWNYTFVVDASDPTQPTVVSPFPQPTPSEGLPYRNYYEKGGRSGPHNQHHYQHMDCLWRPSDLVFMSCFNMGLRIFDVSDPLAPSEVGHYVPENPTERRGSLPSTLVTQFEDVLVDARGYIYCTDKNHGLFVLEHDLAYEGYTGG